MLGLLVTLLFLVWLVGLAVGDTLGGFLHLLPVLGVVTLIISFLGNRLSVRRRAAG